MTRIRNDLFDPRKGLDRGRPAWVEAVWYVLKCLFFLSPLPWPSSFKCALLRLFGATIGRGVYLKPRLNVHFPWKLRIGDHAWVGEEVFILNFEPVAIGAAVAFPSAPSSARAITTTAPLRCPSATAPSPSRTAPGWARRVRRPRRHHRHGSRHHRWLRGHAEPAGPHGLRRQPLRLHEAQMAGGSGQSLESTTAATWLGGRELKLPHFFPSSGA